MIDERTLVDASRCPSCASPLLRTSSCPTCGVDLQGPTARTLWQVSVQAAELLAERARLIAVLRADVAPAQAGAPAATTWQSGSVAAPIPAPTPAAAAAPPAPEWTRRKVQNLLLSLGVGLLAVAAVVFL